MGTGTNMFSTSPIRWLNSWEEMTNRLYSCSRKDWWYLFVPWMEGIEKIASSSHTYHIAYKREPWAAMITHVGTPGTDSCRGSRIVLVVSDTSIGYHQSVPIPVSRASRKCNGKSQHAYTSRTRITMYDKGFSVFVRSMYQYARR